MSYSAEILIDLRTTLLSVAGVPASIAYFDRPYDPDPTVPHLREKLRFVASTVATLGPYSGQTREDMIYDLTIRNPVRTPDVPAMLGLADALAGAFYSGRRVGGVETYGNIYGVRRGDVAQDMRTEWLDLPVRVSFFVYRRTVPVELT